MNTNHKTGYSNRPFNAALPALLGKNQPQRRNKIPVYDQLPPANSDEIDGADHINVHHHAKSDIGRALSQYGEYELIHPKYGNFLTVHGLVCWLSNPLQPDSYRTLSGKDVDARLKLITDARHLPDYGFQVMWATWYKILSHAKLMTWVKSSTLKFEHYFLFRPQDITNAGKRSSETKRQRNKSSWWMISGMEELRTALKEGREPNLDFLLIKSEREKLNKQRKLESQKVEKERQTDVVIEGGLRDNTAKVVKERTPEQIARRAAKNKAKRENRESRRGEGQSNNPQGEIVQPTDDRSQDTPAIVDPNFQHTRVEIPGTKLVDASSGNSVVPVIAEPTPGDEPKDEATEAQRPAE